MAEPSTSPSGAAAPWQAQLQAQRLAQLQAMTQAELQALVLEMTTAERLPRLSLHFRRHGHEFRAQTPQEYETLFLAHIRRPYLYRFTFLDRETTDTLWYLIEMGSGDIAIYNETRRRAWSFLRSPHIQSLLGGTHGYWVELVRTPTDWEVRPW
ncbi:MAG: hypothetical protein HY689_11420 [Chloroflexi bacterium]|nr:hypothetical protein [Chloroflexota bacterium]